MNLIYEILQCFPRDLREPRISYPNCRISHVTFIKYPHIIDSSVLVYIFILHQIFILINIKCQTIFHMDKNPRAIFIKFAMTSYPQLYLQILNSKQAKAQGVIQMVRHLQRWKTILALKYSPNAMQYFGSYHTEIVKQAHYLFQEHSLHNAE